MSGQDHGSLVRFRLEQADEALAAARLLLEAGLLRQAAGRAYYAMFYAVLALLAIRGLGTSKHAGALSLFDREFVKTGAFAREHSKRLHELFELRQRADYLEMFTISPERARSAVEWAGEFVTEVGKYLRGETAT